MAVGMKPADGRFARAALPHLDAAYRLARWLVHDPVAAQDVTQDALVRAMTYFASFRGENFSAWLLRIVRSTAYTHLAARRPDQKLTEAHDELPDPAPGPDAALIQAEDGQALERALNALPGEWRECLVLREIEGMSYRDIAGITGVPVGTVMSRLFRARQFLMNGAQPKGAAHE